MAILRRWGPVLIWMAFIFFLSAQSRLPTPEPAWLDFLFEKTAHFFEFAVLAALILRALEPARIGRRRGFILSVTVAWIYALSDEFHQVFVPGRQADWWDIAFDWAGAFVGVSVAVYWWTIRKNQVYAVGAETPPSAKVSR